LFVDEYSSFYNYIESNNLTVVKFLCSLDCVDPSAGHNRAVIYASANGYLEVVKFLCSLDCVDPSDNNNYAIKMASSYGNLDVVKFLKSV
ncbi:MAG: ankyrin repeat domain-containing protein, partial [Clostridium sp.]